MGCEHCGSTVSGSSVRPSSGRYYCSATECRKARDRAYRAERRPHEQAVRAARRAAGMPDVVRESKRCPRCEQTKPSSEWYKNATAPDGLSSRCKACEAAYSKERWPNGRKPGQRKRYLRQNYDLTPGQYDAMSEAQGGRCFVCQVQPKRLDVDHCHATGVVRGLLCHRCNTAIGLLGDDPNRMVALAAYVLQNVDVLQMVGESVGV